MLRFLYAHLLHSANRNIKSYGESYKTAFYAAKDAILKKYGKFIGYDVQHIKGKRCNSCGGKGAHPRYSRNPPHKIYDWSDCYHCLAGWYKLPVWVCLKRMQLGKFTFHQPIKREERIGNPFTKESIGWEVSERPVIEGYIEHTNHRLGEISIYIILSFYNPTVAREFLRDKIYWKKVYWRNKYRNVIRWQSYIIFRPKFSRTEYWYDNDDVPF